MSDDMKQTVLAEMVALRERNGDVAVGEWIVETIAALRQHHAELAPHLDHLCAMYAAGAPRPGGQQVQPPAEAISQPTLRRTVRPIVEAWLASEAKQGLGGGR